MKSFEVAIIDDDPASSNKLENLILSLDKECRVNKFETINGFIQTNLKPDALFLDVELNDEEGFDLYGRQEIDFPVILISGHAEFAATGFEYNVFDFIVKPFTISRVKTVFNKLNTFKNSNLSKDRILVSVGDEFKVVDINSIVKLMAKGKYTDLHLYDTTLIISSNNLGYFEQILNPRVFFRANNSCMINLNRIGKILKGLQLKIIMDDGSEVLLSKRQKAAFISLFNKI